ncbi:MAG: hypothetical protein DI528_09140 [Shinella sp.]|nr:MAG: hypothetical protein DI528_09140 [Shinella sp.]
MTDIGTLSGGTTSAASAVTYDGLVVMGSANTADGSGRAIPWTDAGGIIDLGALGGARSEAIAMSNDGSMVVGGSKTAIIENSQSVHHTYRWEVGANGINTKMTDLGTLGGNRSYAWDVNASGTIVVG